MAAAWIGSVHATSAPFAVMVMDDSVPVRLARHALYEVHTGPDALIVPDVITCSQPGLSVAWQGVGVSVGASVGAAVGADEQMSTESQVALSALASAYAPMYTYSGGTDAPISSSVPDTLTSSPVSWFSVRLRSPHVPAVSRNVTIESLTVISMS